MLTNTGELAALAVAIVWTITAVSFEHAALRIGSLNVNILRLPLAFLLLCIFTYVSRGVALPTDATASQWFWLSLSGFIGFVLGDLFLFQSFIHIGSRFSMLIMTLVPPFTALLGYIFLGERLPFLAFAGMALTIAGIAIAVSAHKDIATQNTATEAPEQQTKASKHRVRGILYAIGGALGQAGGLVVSKIGMGNYNAAAATQIRILTGIVGFVVIMLVLKRFSHARKALTNRQAMKSVLVGSVFGPFIGVSLSLYAIQHANTGIASTIMSIVPILIIFPSWLIFKQKITWAEIIGAVISVAGVGLFFI